MVGLSVRCIIDWVFQPVKYKFNLVVVE
jgi:hypothetical protein